MKTYLKLILLLVSFLLIFPACGGGGSSNNEETEGDVGITNSQNNLIPRRIQNPIKENKVPVGLSSFSLGVTEKFPYGDESQAEGVGYLQVSRAIRHIATNELYNFPEKPDPNKVYESLKILVEQGHLVTHQIHILNGPGMRTKQDRWINSIMGQEVSDDYFNQLLRSNSIVRDKVLNLFSEVVEHARRLEQLGITVLICPELEDNQTVGDSGGFGIFLDFLNRVGWSDRSKIVRNGGSVGRIPGIRYEVHPEDLNHLRGFNLRPGDVVNMDGKSFGFGNSVPSFLHTEEDVRDLIKFAEEKQIIFYIWYGPLQGLVQASRYGYYPYPSYDDRYYILDNPKVMISLLMGIKESEVVIE